MRGRCIYEVDVVFCEFCSAFKIAHTKRRATTATSVFHERYFEPKGFQHFDGGDSDVRFVIAHEGVVPEDDFAPSGERGRLARCFWCLAKNCCIDSVTAVRYRVAPGVTRGA